METQTEIRLDVSPALYRALSVCSAEMGLTISQFMIASAVTGIHAMQAHDPAIDMAVKRAEAIFA